MHFYKAIVVLDNIIYKRPDIAETSLPKKFGDIGTDGNMGTKMKIFA